MITTKILLDSVNMAGNRITTWELTYPRFIHSEILTHRCLARNAASSRAIPVEKMINALRQNPAMFEQYGAVNKGMSAQKLMEPYDIERFQTEWEELACDASDWAERWKSVAAKQLVNRALEPWMHMTVIVTGTEWKNFFALRAHKDAQPEFQVLAYRMLDKYLNSPAPRLMADGGWHLPLVSSDHAAEEDDRGTPLYLFQGEDFYHVAKRLSVARCARVSYTTHDVEDTPVKCYALHDRLLASGHMSPFEHQAQAVSSGTTGPFRGWLQYRKTLPNENREDVNLQEILNNKPEWVTL